MKFRTLLVFLLVFGFALAEPASAQMLPKVVVGVEQAKSPQEASIALQVIFLVTILSLASEFATRPASRALQLRRRYLRSDAA